MDNLSTPKQKQEVQQTITDYQEVLSQCKTKLQEVTFVSDEHQKEIQNKRASISQARQEVIRFVDEYFTTLVDNHILLTNKYPTNQTKEKVVQQIDQTLIRINDFNSKIASNTFSSDDYHQFKLTDIERAEQEVKTEVHNLEEASKSHVASAHSLPVPKINNRVIEGLYHPLNEYASTFWPGDSLLTQYTQPVIQMHSYFECLIMPLPIIDDEKGTFGFYDINTKQTTAKNYTQTLSILPNHQPTVVVTPQGEIYLIGGLSNKGLIVNYVHKINPKSGELFNLSQLNVKRVGASACYVKSQDPKSMGYIYVFGGRTDNNVRTKLCERYDIIKNKWENISKMTVARSAPACCYDEANSTIYTFFGTDSDQRMINVVEKYNVDTDKWTLVELTNYLPGFEVTLSGAVQINKDMIMIFGGLRDSHYFRDQLYFSRKVLFYNTTNDSFFVSDWSLPVDFIPLCNPLVQDHKVYAIGNFLQTYRDDKPVMYLKGANVLQFDLNGPQLISYVQSSSK